MSASLQTTDRAHEWLKQWQADVDEPHYTHSSFWGAWDWDSSSGKFKIHESDEHRSMLFDCINVLYQNCQPLCVVEMCTDRRPFIEDIDVLGPCEGGENNMGTMDAIFLESEFFALRASCPTVRNHNSHEIHRPFWLKID